MQQRDTCRRLGDNALLQTRTGGDVLRVFHWERHQRRGALQQRLGRRRRAATWGAYGKSPKLERKKRQAPRRERYQHLRAGQPRRHRRDIKTLKEIAAAVSRPQTRRTQQQTGLRHWQGHKNTGRRRLARGMQRVCLRRMAREVDNKGAEHAEEWRRKQRAELPAPRRTKVTMKHEAHARKATEASGRIQERKGAQPKQQALLHRVCSRRHWDLCARPA
ncbi:hypothetical protein ERJ75_000694000 [Trypanosoma vivax]|nr:hypothetical protein ERJ75_000694000 [Trypanosoma vivax]